MLLAGTGGSVAADGQPELWQPPPDARWQYQLESANRYLAPSGGIKVEICEVPRDGGACMRPDVFDIDLYVDARVSGNNRTINAAGVQAIHDRGGHAICYVSAGTAERFRPDYDRYVRFDRRHRQSLLGKPFSSVFPNERWLNVKNGRGQRDFILRRVGARTAKCARAGFDGVEYDNVDAYAQGRKVTGWRIRPSTQVIFNRALARIAHRNGLSVALKNDLGQLERLEPRFDYAINEQCFQYHECAANLRPGYRAFMRAGKAVFQVEYGIPRGRFCDRAAALGTNSIKKAGDFSLSARPWKPCR
ncbi:MAG TPA: endo alpha-1,4 polygalactosaminidase [Solirubrobacterales bacterium]|nr:endo alpha-1,4 polygalactosaminidase [Solirubrobacterales bacterium]